MKFSEIRLESPPKKPSINQGYQQITDFFLYIQNKVEDLSKTYDFNIVQTFHHCVHRAIRSYLESINYHLINNALFRGTVIKLGDYSFKFFKKTREDEMCCLVWNNQDNKLSALYNFDEKLYKFYKVSRKQYSHLYLTRFKSFVDEKIPTIMYSYYSEDLLEE